MACAPVSPGAVSMSRPLVAVFLGWLISAACLACPPEQTINVVVPFAPGGSLDATTRVLADEVARVMRRPILVRNVPGASGALGAKDVLSAPHDGCTILAGAVNTVVLVPLMNPNAGFTARDLRPLAKVGHTDVVLIARADTPVHALADLAGYEHALGRPLSAGHPGHETVQALALKLVEATGEAHFVEVPYNGSARLLSDLLGGHLDLAVVALPAVTPLQRQGRIKVVARLTRGQGVSFDSWAGWFVPTSVPAADSHPITEALLTAMDDEDVQRALLRLGAPTPARGEQRRFARQIQQSLARYAQMLAPAQRPSN
jgi:tripartite-type tricarboxylate transporter receptor subunit TctC